MSAQSAAFATPPASIDTAFDSILAASDYVHRLLPIDRANSLDARFKAKAVDKEISINSLAEKPIWRHDGRGVMIVGDSMGSSPWTVEMRYPIRPVSRAVGPPFDPDYANYGYTTLTCQLPSVNVESYNRIYFKVFPKASGRQVVNLNFRMINDPLSPHKEPHNFPTGDHLVNLIASEWNDCSLEIDDFDRDAVDTLVFSVTLNGHDQFSPDSCSIIIDDIKFQRVDQPEKIAGWEPTPGRLSYSMTGYDWKSPKTAIVSPKYIGEKFVLSDVSIGASVFEATVKAADTTIGYFGVIDFSDFKTKGVYQLTCGDMVSHPFRLGEAEIWHDSLWKVVNFAFGMRCGFQIDSIHPICHTDLFAVHDDVRLPYSGGWHDAGDLSQQTLQTCEVTCALLEASEAVKSSNPLLSARLKEEARHGLDFILKTRFGDGFRASGMGLLIWLDGKIGSFDDITSVRVQDVSFDNFLHSGYEAYASRVLSDDDAAYSGSLRAAAIEDFRFAEKKFAEKGYGGFISQYEHTFNTPKILMHAVMVWSAAQLYKLTGDEHYVDVASENVKYVLDCQQTSPIEADSRIKGFFYCDKLRRSVVHFIHQSREDFIISALDQYVDVASSAQSRGEALAAMKLYGQYIKDIMPATAPYSMIPAGIYLDDEYADTANFYACHLFPPDNAPELFKKQITGGLKVGPNHYLKRFPVWFNIFNGNLAVHTSVGKAAAIIGNRLNDKELTNLAREQLYWTVGKNPFAQSLLYGEGHDYPQFNNFSSGEITGTLPVGIRTLGDSDSPYWPQINNACYKEAWMTSAGKWLSLVATLSKN